ncbi:MAG TPA: hypothetical protein VII90_02725 [Anaerolineales bacterium]
MKARLQLTLGACFLPASCGTLKIGIDEGNAPVPRSTETRPDFAKTIGAISTWTTAPSVT